MDGHTNQTARCGRDPLQFILRIIKGAVVGVGAILPGISGGVLSVVFGIYRPLMEFLAHPVKEFKRKAWFFLPILIGFVLGILGLARVVDWLFRESPVPAVWLFSGLVIGTLPALWREAGQQGRGRFAWLAMAIATVLTALWMYLVSSMESGGEGALVTPNVWWWLVCGVLWGMGMVVPGMSPSSIFIFLGLYQPMTAGISQLDVGVVLPLLVGLASTVALLSRGMGWLLKRHYAVVLHAIFGIVIASTAAILPFGQGTMDAGSIALYAACFIVGCAIAYGMERMRKVLEDRGEVD